MVDTETKLRAAARAVEGVFGVGLDRLRSRARPARVAEARHAFVLLAGGVGVSMSAIGRYIKRDHTTAIASRKRGVQLLAAPGGSQFARDFDEARAAMLRDLQPREVLDTANRLEAVLESFRPVADAARALVLAFNALDREMARQRRTDHDDSPAA